MDERTIQPPGELPVSLASRPAGGLDPTEPAAGLAPLQDPRALTILTTEHWSLLSARGLVYNEAFARAGMFLTFLSATIVALGLVSTGIGFRKEFLVVAAGVLAVDLFIGLATLGRVVASTTEDLRYLQGMNRLRHAYHETVPGLERYFVTSQYDDLPGVFGTRSAVLRAPGVAIHHFSTMPGMVAVICASVAAALAADILLLATGSATIGAIGAVLVLIAGVVGSALLASRAVRRLARSIDSQSHGGR
jgi:hypothetical protein